MNRSNLFHLLAGAAVLLSAIVPARACTSFLITRGASVDGSTMITYAADSHLLYGELYYTPARSHVPGETLEIIEWDTGKRLGEIPQVAQTYSVIGNMNEHQVAISETTWGGRPELRDPAGVLDYGSLIYITLQRATTAREAITIMTDLANAHGYYSGGETMSIADPDEVWLMDIVGKGAHDKGAVWVARKIPDGYISGHANSPRIRKFPMDDPDTLFAPDVVSFARKQGYYEGPDADFDFAAAYGATDFGSLRFCDARVWCMFRRTAPATSLPVKLVSGQDDSEPIPLWIKPERKLSVRDVQGLMRDHFEGTELDMTRDIGAGPYQLPYRWRPLTWKVGDKEYLNERATSTQQTGFSFVTQSRAWLPDPIGGVLWFGLDDTYSTVYTPMYCANTAPPPSFAVGSGNFDSFSWDSAFWTFNFVSNYAYLRYNAMIRDVQVVQRELEGKFAADQARIEAAALALYEQSPRLAVEYLTNYSIEQGEMVVKRWRKLGEHLVWKYLDGNVRNELGEITQPGYPESWYEVVAQATGEKLVVTETKPDAAPAESDSGEAAQLASGILKLMAARGIPVNGGDREKVEACADAAKLKAWLIRAATVESAAALFADH